MNMPRIATGASKLTMLALLLLLVVAWPDAQAQQVLPGVTATPGANGTTNYSVPIQTLLFFTFLSFLPALLLMMTGFTRIVIVMSLLRTRSLSG